MGEEPNTHWEKTPDIEEVVEQVGKFQRKVDSLSKAVDYLTDEVMPDLFKENLEKAYKNTQKAVDHIIKYLLF